MSKKIFTYLVFISMLFAMVFAVGLSPAVAEDHGSDEELVDIQFLNVSDWHGQLDPLFVFGTGNLGGAAELSSYFQADREANPNTLTLTAGDAFGASPPLSSFFNEEPAVQAMNLMGFDVDTLGNHNFDKGIDHLQQMINLAEFQYVSANLENRDDNLTGVKDFEIFDMGGVKVGVVGITNPEAPTLVFPGSFGTIEVTNPVPAANKAAAKARAAGAKVIVAITHLGVEGFDPVTGEPFGALIDFAEKVGGFDLIYGDHTDVSYSGVIKTALVVENASKGKTYAKVNMTVDPKNGQIHDRSVEFVVPFSENAPGGPDPAIVAFLEPFRTELQAKLGEVVGNSDVYIPRSDACGVGNGRTCESLVGNVTTDAMREIYGTDFALTNAGGLRADLTCPEVDNPTDLCPSYTPPPYPISAGQVLTVLPFGNVVVTLDVSGAELKGMLENGVSAMPGIDGRFAQVSGLCFTYDIDAAPGSRVLEAVWQAEDGTCTGPVVDLSSATTYSLATNDFVASGGDGYPDFSSRMVTLDFMDKVVIDYIETNTPIHPTIQGRVDCTGSICPVVTP